MVKTFVELSHVDDIKLLHDNAMILIALLASLPFWLRVRQCWVQYDGCNDSISRIPIVLNMIKYTTAFPPIWITGISTPDCNFNELYFIKSIKYS